MISLHGQRIRLFCRPLHFPLHAVPDKFDVAFPVTALANCLSTAAFKIERSGVEKDQLHFGEDGCPGARPRLFGVTQKSLERVLPEGFKVRGRRPRIQLR